MTSIRKQALALCLATCFSSLSSAQDYTTNNLIDGTWYGTINNTTVTGGEGSHTQSSGPTPIYNSDTDTITWSYSGYSVLNVIGINAALNAAGTGIRITGYNYSWEYYNQNFNRGFLSATTQQYGLNDTLLEQYSYQMPQTTNGWTQFGGTQNYSNQYELTQLGDFYLYFTGRDDRFWAGYYGPMVRNTSITFNYTVGAVQPEPDPCASPYSLLCTQNTLTLTESVTASEPIVEAASIVASESTLEVAGALSSLQQLAPTESTSTSLEQSGSRVSISTILSVMSREQSRIGALERSTVETSAEQSATQSFQATQEAESIAAGAQFESVSISVSAQESSQPGGAALNFSSNDSTLSSALLSGSSGPRGADATELVAEETKNESVSVSGFSATDILQQETNTRSEDTQREQKTETVKQNVLNNELAGDVTIASLGSAPQGFQSYLIGMPDVAFYTPREIYRNQRTVDNPLGRRLFGGSDRLHQEMVDEQYKR